VVFRGRTCHTLPNEQREKSCNDLLISQGTIVICRDLTVMAYVGLRYLLMIMTKSGSCLDLYMMSVSVIGRALITVRNRHPLVFVSIY
jgi:hypothetical protein